LKQIILFGGGGHAVSCSDLIECANEYTIQGVVVGDSLKNITGFPTLGSDDDIAMLRSICDRALIAFGFIKDAQPRLQLAKTLIDFGYDCPPIVSPFAYVSDAASVNEGVTVMHMAVVNALASIGEFCILNTGCVVEHGVSLGAGSHVAPRAVIGGDCVIGSGVFVGAGAVVEQGSFVKDNTVIPANSFFRSDRGQGRG
jgi:sugar O-acyltransferase (sialic acid O-acetyltransferase NeuD family)